MQKKNKSMVNLSALVNEHILERLLLLLIGSWALVEGGGRIIAALQGQF